MMTLDGWCPFEFNHHDFFLSVGGDRVPPYLPTYLNGSLFNYLDIVFQQAEVK